MDKLSLANYHFWQRTTEGQDASFVFTLSNYIQTGSDHRMIIKQCIVPKMDIKIEEGFVSLNDGPKIHTPPFYVLRLSDVVDKINVWLDSVADSFLNSIKKVPDNKMRLDLLPGDKVKLTLKKGESLRVSQNLANLLFEGRDHLRASQTFNLAQDDRENFYYLSCDVVDLLQSPYVATLTRDHSVWRVEEAQGKLTIRTGIHNRLVFSVRDKTGAIVKLDRGLFYLQFKICT